MSVITDKEEFALQAKYECMNCKHLWVGKAGFVSCPMCKHEYVRWLNWESVSNKVYEKSFDWEKGKWKC